MTRVHKDFDFSGLSPAERILLAQRLWDSVHDETHEGRPPVTGQQRAEIRRRVAEIDAGRVGWHTWNEVVADLRRK